MRPTVLCSSSGGTERLRRYALAQLESAQRFIDRAVLPVPPCSMHCGVSLTTSRNLTAASPSICLAARLAASTAAFRS